MSGLSNFYLKTNDAMMKINNEVVIRGTPQKTIECVKEKQLKGRLPAH